MPLVFYLDELQGHIFPLLAQLITVCLSWSSLSILYQDTSRFGLIDSFFHDRQLISNSSPTIFCDLSSLSPFTSASWADIE